VKVGHAIELAHSSTIDLSEHLRAVAERHASDHAVYHVGGLLAGRCREVADLLQPFAERYRQELDDPPHPFGELLERTRRATAIVTGRAEETGMLLLRDLRELATEAHGAQMDWTILRQGASVARDQPLVDAATVGQDEMRRVEAWLTTRIKETAPQVLAG
jgi:hypothetical protein